MEPKYDVRLLEQVKALAASRGATVQRQCDEHRRTAGVACRAHLAPLGHTRKSISRPARRPDASHYASAHQPTPKLTP